MKLYVWAPGILGSELVEAGGQGRMIWPPGEVKAFQSRTFQQLTSALRPRGIIQEVCVLPIYTRMTALFAQAGIHELAAGVPPARALLSFPYDWRLGLAVEAGRLADRLDQVTTDQDEIHLVGHSMGALLLRHLLERPEFHGRGFRARVRKYVSINGPLNGAPVMLARALGLEATEFVVWADTPKLLGTAPYAGAYCLLPAPDQGRLFDNTRPIDIYDPYYYEALGLGGQNVTEAKTGWDRIAAGARPANCEYVLISSRIDDDAGTIERVRYKGGWIREYGPGDGLVPPWSSQGLADVTLPDPVPGEHRGVIDTQAFRALFDAHIADLPAAAGGEPDLFLQPLKRQVRSGSVAEFVVVREGATQAAEAELVWRMVGDDGTPKRAIVRREAVGLPGQASPTVRTRAPDAPGLYDVAIKLGAQRAHSRIGIRPVDEQQVPADAPPA